jgi:ABC-type phosphate transport system substrate-binding protein
MNDVELKSAAEAGGAVVHVPLTMGSVAPVYNLPGVKSGLRFTGPILASIFMGRVQRWNDPGLAALNPNFTLPDREIAVVHRLGSSGTTYGTRSSLIRRRSPVRSTRPKASPPSAGLRTPD